LLLCYLTADTGVFFKLLTYLLTAVENIVKYDRKDSSFELRRRIIFSHFFSAEHLFANKQLYKYNKSTNKVLI
jgi:hypothetical protein